MTSQMASSLPKSFYPSSYSYIYIYICEDGSETLTRTHIMLLPCTPATTHECNRFSVVLLLPTPPARAKFYPLPLSSPPSPPTPSFPWSKVRSRSKPCVVPICAMHTYHQHFILLLQSSPPLMDTKANNFFYVTVSQCKWVSGVDTYEAEVAADSILWELFAKESAECLNLCNSFITII